MAKDLFSKQAEEYSLYRPHYPQELFSYVASFTHEKNRALDCATGNGQAAVPLAGFFEEVYAIDTSEKQLQHAAQHPRVHYKQASAEQTGFAENTFDLLTVAQAYHWFKFDAFAAEAARILKPAGVVAIWGYGLIQTNIDPLQKLLNHFYTAVVGKYWDAERRYVDEEYKTVPFPFEHLPGRDFRIRTTWNRENLSGYLNTWSSVQHAIRQTGENPVNGFESEFNQLGISAGMMNFEFPVFLLLGRVNK